MYNRESGIIGEAEALRCLTGQGMKVLEKNYRRAGGEIDLIVRDGDTIVFVEVKARTDNARNIQRYGRPSNAVTKHKQKLISEAAFFYMRSNNLIMAARIDVIEVYFYPAPEGQLPAVKRVHHIPNAFYAIR